MSSPKNAAPAKKESKERVDRFAYTPGSNAKQTAEKYAEALFNIEKINRYLARHAKDASPANKQAELRKLEASLNKDKEFVKKYGEWQKLQAAVNKWQSDNADVFVKIRELEAAKRQVEGSTRASAHSEKEEARRKKLQAYIDAVNNDEAVVRSELFVSRLEECSESEALTPGDRKRLGKKLVDPDEAKDVIADCKERIAARLSSKRRRVEEEEEEEEDTEDEMEN